MKILLFCLLLWSVSVFAAPKPIDYKLVFLSDQFSSFNKTTLDGRIEKINSLLSTVKNPSASGLRVLTVVEGFGTNNGSEPDFSALIFTEHLALPSPGEIIAERRDRFPLPDGSEIEIKNFTTGVLDKGPQSSENNNIVLVGFDDKNDKMWNFTYNFETKRKHAFGPNCSGAYMSADGHVSCINKDLSAELSIYSPQGEIQEKTKTAGAEYTTAEGKIETMDTGINYFFPDLNVGLIKTKMGEEKLVHYDDPSLSNPKESGLFIALAFMSHDRANQFKAIGRSDETVQVFINTAQFPKSLGSNVGNLGLYGITVPCRTAEFETRYCLIKRDDASGGLKVILLTYNGKPLFPIDWDITGFKGKKIAVGTATQDFFTNDMYLLNSITGEVTKWKPVFNAEFSAVDQHGDQVDVVCQRIGNCSADSYSVACECIGPNLGDPNQNSGNALIIGSFDTTEESSSDSTAKLYLNDKESNLNITQQGDVALAVGIEAGNNIGKDSDYWLVVNYQGVWFSYNLANNTWEPGIKVTYQGPLVDIPKTILFNVKANLLALGVYTIYLGADFKQDGKLPGENDTDFFVTQKAMTIE